MSAALQQLIFRGGKRHQNGGLGIHLQLATPTRKPLHWLRHAEFTCSYCSSYGLACTLVARDGGTADVSKVCRTCCRTAIVKVTLHSLHESCMILHISCLHGLSRLAIILSRGGRAFRKECDTCIFKSDCTALFNKSSKTAAKSIRTGCETSFHYLQIQSLTSCIK